MFSSQNRSKLHSCIRLISAFNNNSSQLHQKNKVKPFCELVKVCPDMYKWGCLLMSQGGLQSRVPQSFTAVTPHMCFPLNPVGSHFRLNHKMTDISLLWESMRLESHFAPRSRSRCVNKKLKNLRKGS